MALLVIELLMTEQKRMERQPRPVCLLVWAAPVEHLAISLWLEL